MQAGSGTARFSFSRRFSAHVCQASDICGTAEKPPSFVLVPGENAEDIADREVVIETRDDADRIACPYVPLDVDSQ